MASEGEESIPTVTTEERDLTNVKVVVFIPGFTTKGGIIGKKTPGSNSTVNVTLEESSLEVAAEVKGKKFRYRCNKLPSSIDKDKSKIEYKKEQVIFKLVKCEETSWAVYLKSGLDQAPDDS